MELDYWSKKFDELKPYLMVVDSRVGDLVVYAYDNIVSYAIRLYGEYSHAEINVMCRYLNKDSGYIDVGTNIGYHARAVHQQAGCDVLAFEPNPNHFVVASYNCQKLPIQIVNAAVGDHTGKAHVSSFVPDQVENFGSVSLADSGEEVDLVTLDNMDLVKCTVIKIDVEGHEIEVLRGAEQTINKFHPVIFYEAQEDYAWPECYEFLEQHGYQQYWVACRNSPVGDCHRRPDEDPFGTSGVINILAVPNTWPQPTDLMPVVMNQQYNEAAQVHKNNIMLTKHY